LKRPSAALAEQGARDRPKKALEVGLVERGQRLATNEEPVELVQDVRVLPIDLVATVDLSEAQHAGGPSERELLLHMRNVDVVLPHEARVRAQDVLGVEVVGVATASCWMVRWEIEQVEDEVARHNLWRFDDVESLKHRQADDSLRDGFDRATGPTS
jgi:hypothetical protein